VAPDEEDAGWELYGGEAALGLALGARLRLEGACASVIGGGGGVEEEESEAARRAAGAALASAAARALEGYARKWRTGGGEAHTATFYANWRVFAFCVLRARNTQIATFSFSHCRLASQADPGCARHRGGRFAVGRR
jgi:hypothetical protein